MDDNEQHFFKVLKAGAGTSSRPPPTATWWGVPGELVAEGHTPKEIGELLFVSTKTVERHRAKLLHKLGMRDRLEP